MTKYFNHFKMYGYNINQALYRKPTFNEIYEMIMAKHIISEYVFDSTKFQKLYDFILKENKSINCFTTQKLLEFFDIKSKIFKILSKNKNINSYQLYVVITDKSNENIKNIITEICADIDKNVLDDEDIQIIYKSFRLAAGLFTPLNDSTDFGILWLSDKIDLNTFAHEFIHYIEWLSGIYGKDIKINLDENETYFSDQDLFLKMFNCAEPDLDYIFNKFEYQTLLNDFLNSLENIYQKYYSDKISQYEFARLINYHFYNDCKNISAYLNKVNSFEYFDELNKNDSFGLIMVVGYNCIKYKQMNISNHIFGKFKK